MAITKSDTMVVSGEEMGLESFSKDNPARICVIDDEVKIGALFERFLEDPRMDVTFCDHPQKGWQTIDKENFDIIITDLKMPLIGGYELIEIIRNNEFNKDVPIILCSAFIDKTTHANLSLVNKIYYLNKPFQRDELLEKINHVLAVRKKSIPINAESIETFKDGFKAYFEQKLGTVLPEWQEKRNFEGVTTSEVGTILSWSGEKSKTEAFISVQEKAFLEIVSQVQGIKYWHMDEESSTLFFEFFEEFSKVINKKLKNKDATVIHSHPIMMTVLNASFFGPDYYECKFYEIPTTMGIIKIRISSVKK